MNFSILVYDKNLPQTYPHSSIGYCISIPISKSSIKRELTIWKQLSYVPEGSNLKYLRLSVHNFSNEGSQQTIWAQYHRSIRHNILIILFNPSYVVSCQICITNRSRSQIQNLITILLNLCV